MEGAQDISEHEGNVADHGFGEDGGYSRECVVSTDRGAWNGATGEYKNGSDGVDVLFDLSCHALLVELVLLNTAHVGQPRSVEDANILDSDKSARQEF